MRKVLSTFSLFFIALLSLGILLSQSDEDAKFQKIVDSYLDELWKFYPTSATLAGYHKYDNKLEDLSEGNLDKRSETLDKFNQELVAKVDKLKLSPEMQIDHEMLVDSLDYEILLHENLLPWEYNPIFYNEIFFNCIKSLLIKDFAPLESRAKNAAERLKELPKLIKQAKDNLKTPPQLFTETALKQLPGIIDFYKNELPALISQTPSSSQSLLQSNLTKVIPALEDYRNFLQKELLPRSTGNFRLGEQAHRTLVRLTFQNSIPLQELIARANADYKNIRREMFLVCIPFYKIMDPKIDLENPPANLTEDQIFNTTISHVFEKTKDEHTTKEEFIDEIRKYAAEIKEFFKDKQLIETPEVDLKIEAMALAHQGITWTRVVTPGAYETDGEYSLEITPIPDYFDQNQVSSFLEEYNNFYLPFWTIRMAYPGQFYPTYYSRKHSSLIRRLFPNLPLIKGWPLYVEEMAIKSGFGNYDLRLRLAQLKLKLKAVIDFLLEFNIHEGGMTKEQAIAYMVRGGFQSEAEAERKWNRIILKPADSAFPYVGYQEILDIEKDYRTLKGESFSQKEFLSSLLNHGALSIRHLKKKLIEK